MFVKAAMSSKLPYTFAVQSKEDSNHAFTDVFHCGHVHNFYSCGLGWASQAQALDSRAERCASCRDQEIQGGGKDANDSAQQQYDAKERTCVSCVSIFEIATYCSIAFNVR
jgi:hypothetical protein